MPLHVAEWHPVCGAREASLVKMTASYLSCTGECDKHSRKFVVLSPIMIAPVIIQSVLSRSWPHLFGATCYCIWRSPCMLRGFPVCLSDLAFLTESRTPLDRRAHEREGGTWGPRLWPGPDTAVVWDLPRRPQSASKGSSPIDIQCHKI